MMFAWERQVRMAPNECIEFPENPLYTNIAVLNDDRSSPPYRLVHVYPQGSSTSLSRPLTSDEIWNDGAPVIFVPGHGGSYNQTKSSAAQAAVEAKSLHGGARLNFFAIDTLSVPSGLAAELLWSQAKYVNLCIRTILKEYKARRKHSSPSSVIILAHSMGGMAARAVPLVPNYLIGSIGAIITLNTPHSAPPYSGDGHLEEFYSRVNGVWGKETSWLDESIGDQPETTASRRERGEGNGRGGGERERERRGERGGEIGGERGGGGLLHNIVIASIAGGSRDHVVRGDLTSLKFLSPQGRSVHAWSTSLPGVWIQMDHDAIVWCGQLIAVLARAIMSMHSGSSSTTRLIERPTERLEAFEMALYAGRRRHDMDIVLPDTARSWRKRAVIVSQAHSHTFVGSRSLSIENSKEMRVTRSSGDDDVDLARGICVPLPTEVSRARESLAIVTDVAPFRSVTISSCNVECSRGGRTNAHDWLASKSNRGRKSSDKGCKTMDDMRILVMPHSRRRHHLHHSYDPRMHFGRERHQHRWSRVTAADLVDEAKYRHSGSIHAVVLDKAALADDADPSFVPRSVHVHFEHRTPFSKELWEQLVHDKALEIATRQQLVKQGERSTRNQGRTAQRKTTVVASASISALNAASLIPSVRSMAIDEIGSFLKWSSLRHHDNGKRKNNQNIVGSEDGSPSDSNSGSSTGSGSLDWFLQTQWFTNPTDLYLGNHLCDGETTRKPIKDINDVESSSASNFTSNSASSKAVDDTTLPLFSSQSSMSSAFVTYASFFFSLLTQDEWQAPAGHPWMMHLGSCSLPYTRFTPQNLAVRRTGCTSHAPTTIHHASDEVSSDRDQDAPGERKTAKRLRSSSGSHFFAPIVRFSILDASGMVEEEMTTTIPPTSSLKNEAGADPGILSYHFSLKGHDYNRPGSSFQVSIVSDPRCSYVITRSTDWYSTAEQLVLGLLPRWISAYHSTLILLLSLQLYKFRSYGEIPSLWVTARSNGFAVVILLTFICTSKAWWVRSSSSSSSSISNNTSIVLNLFLYSTALATVVVINGMIIKFIVIIRLLRQVFLIIVCGQGRGSAPGMCERFCPLSCRLHCRRCCASRTSVLQSIIDTTANRRRERKRSDSDIMTQDYDLSQLLADKTSTGGRSSRVKSFVKMSLSLGLLFVQILLVGGVMIFSPLLILTGGTFFMVATSALSTVRRNEDKKNIYENHESEEEDDNNDNDDSSDSRYQSQESFDIGSAFEVQDRRIEEMDVADYRYRSITSKIWTIPCFESVAPLLIYNRVRRQFFDDRVSYELTCSQLYFSVLMTRAPSLVVAFLRFNPDCFLPFVYWDTVLVVPFLIHITLVVFYREKELSRQWSLIPCTVASFTSVLGVLLYDETMHRLPGINVVLSLALCLLHLNPGIGDGERKRGQKKRSKKSKPARWGNSTVQLSGRKQMEI